MLFSALVCLIAGIGMLVFGYHKAIRGEYSLMRAYREGKCGEKTARASGLLQLVFGALNTVLAILQFVFENKILFYICLPSLLIPALAFTIIYIRNR